MNARFDLEPGGVRILRASATGASMGISLNGVVRTESETVELEGVLSPFYAVNGLGSILTRAGEGLIGVSFVMRGPMSRPQIEINPASFLTPGFLREIFRRQTPADLSVDTQ